MILDGDGYSLVQGLQGTPVVARKAVLDRRPYGALDILVADVGKAVLATDDDA